MTNRFYWPFEFGKKTKANEKLQQLLVSHGFLSDFEVDGIFGRATRDALKDFQQSRGLSPTGEVDRPTEDLLLPGNYERRTPSMNISSNWLSGLVTSTAFKYVLTIASTWLAAKFGLDGDVVLAILTQIVGVVAGIWGMMEAAKSKAVVNGNSVNLASLTPAQQKAVAEVVADAKGVPVSVLTK